VFGAWHVSAGPEAVRTKTVQPVNPKITEDLAFRRRQGLPVGDESLWTVETFRFFFN